MTTILDVLLCIHYSWASMGRRPAAPEIKNRVRAIRLANGLSQQALAQRVGITRQALAAIESQHSIPNTVVALRLARALDCAVEELFALEDRQAVATVEIAAPAPRTVRLALAKVHNRWIGYPLQADHAITEGFLSADGLADRHAAGDSVQLLRPAADLERTALLLGCDPSLSILRAKVEQHGAGTRLLWLVAQSRAALNAVAAGQAHLAGTHLVEAAGQQGNLQVAQSALRKQGGLLVAFTRWEHGLAVRPGNPKKVRSLADLVRRDVRFINRDVGSGSRAMLDALLEKAGLPASAITGYDHVVTNHFAVARAVATGGADVGMAPRATADALGLDFVALAESHFDLVIPRDHLEHPAVALMLELLQSRTLRDELRALPGYDVSAMGTVLAELPAA